MSEAHNREIRISAYSDGFIDLDEYESCVALREALAANLHAGVSCITFDLRKCYLSYQHSSLYLDQALRILRTAFDDSNKSKQLRIMTSIDFGFIEPMAGVFFQLSEEISSNTTDSLRRVIELINRYCMAHGVNIRIEIYDQNVKDDTEHSVADYVFPAPGYEQAT